MYIKFFKRIFDILFSIIALPIFIFLYIILGILIKKEDGGPIIYEADRIGKKCKIFKMYKFRSMKVNAPNILNKDGSTYNSKSDSRVTNIGMFMRKTSLDETPQILNVLKGEMSIIGPRASMASVLTTFKKDEKDKMKVKPGITGYTQAYYRNSISNRRKRLKDSWYANNANFILDIKIFLRTIITVLNQKNVFRNIDNQKLK